MNSNNNSSGSRAKAAQPRTALKRRVDCVSHAKLFHSKRARARTEEREKGRGTMRVGGAAMFQCTNVLACTAWLTDYSPAPHQFRIRLILILFLLLLLRHPLLLALFFLLSVCPTSSQRTRLPCTVKRSMHVFL